MATGKKITLQDKGNNTLYPVTIDQQVLVKDASNVTHTLKETVEFFAGKLKGIEGGTIKVGAASQADNAANATNAETATNLATAPTITNSGANGIEITVGGKGTGSYTIPYATKALQDKDGKDIDKTYAKIQDLKDGVVVPFKAGSLEYEDGNITARGLIDAAKQEISADVANAASKEELNALAGKVTTNTGDINTLKNTVSGHTTSIQNLETADTNFNTRIAELEVNASKVYTPKGSVQDVTALTRLTEVKEGWVYNITNGGEWDDGTEIPAGANAVYIGTTNNMASLYENWDILGGIVDLSNYVTESAAQQTYATKTQLNGKQDKISDLDTIRSGAALGATALQSYTEKYTGTYSKPSGGIPKSDLSSAVQTSLGKADTALQSHQDISGKLDKTTAESTYLKKTDAVSTYAKQDDVESYIGAIGDDNKHMGLTYTVDGTVTY